jgi:4-carboxymuconolactone decarboxylase
MNRRQLLCGVAAAAATGRLEALGRRVAEAAREGVPAADLYEAALQVLLFAGYPRALNALEVLRATLGEGGGEPPSEAEPPDPARRGEEVFHRVYGDDADRVLERLRALHPDFARSVLRDAYGRVLGRPFLPLVERELMAVAMLAALDLPAQLRAHERGALRAGAAPEEVRAARDSI